MSTRAKTSDGPRIDTFSTRQRSQEGESVEVIPEPSFVVKTSDDTGRKVFINICGSEHVPAAGNWAGGVPEEVKQALAQQSHTEEGAEVLRFPISMGPLRRDLDKVTRHASLPPLLSQ